VSDPTGLAVEVLRAEPPLVALPRGHPLAKHRRLRLEHLHGHRAVAVERSQHPALHDLAAAHVAEHGVRLDVVQEVSGKQAVLALVSAGVGLAIVPEGVRALPVRGITYRPLVTPGLELQVGVVWRADRRSAPLLALVAALRRAAGATTG
jgi:DNA-binding transcriptional LysR family regulator